MSAASPDIASLPYRPCVGLMLLNRDNQVFVAKRIDIRSEAWQMPQGGIDEGEDVATAAMRELLEEIGTNNAKIITESADWLKYDLPEALIPNLWDGQFRGQKQKWLALRFLGEDSDINIATETPEFIEWKWVDMAELPHIIVPFKKALYEQVIAEFRHLIG